VLAHKCSDRSRCAGITIVSSYATEVNEEPAPGLPGASALGLACWPGQRGDDSNLPALRAMLVYNRLIALYLAYLGLVGHLGGPAVALHAVIALLLIRDQL
jgi:hypothetical protein